MTTAKHNLIRSLSTIAICTCILVASVFVDWVVIFDKFDAIGFQPTPVVAALKDDLDLTRRASTIFNASHPSVKDGPAFNEVCASANHEVSILGCFDGRRIFVLNVTHPDLAGIKQSTLAHELLHATWDRLSAKDQNNLKPELDLVFAANLATLQPRLDLYPAINFYDELHSIVGTEFTELSLTLETHYARYFNDQDTVVAFFDSYNTKFRELEAEAAALYEQIEINRDLISNKSTNYDDAFVELSVAIDDFNRRAESGYFTSATAFWAERATLVARQQELNRLYGEINTLVSATNQLIDQYNNNIARTQILLDSINSNKPSTPELQ